MRERITVTQSAKDPLSQSPCTVPEALKCFSSLLILNFPFTSASTSSKNGQVHDSILKRLVTLYLLKFAAFAWVVHLLRLSAHLMLRREVEMLPGSISVS